MIEDRRQPSDAAKQLPQADPKPVGNLFDVNQGQIPHSPLNAAVVRAVQPASLRSLFLADALFFAQTTDCTAKADADVGRHARNCRGLHPIRTTADESHINFCSSGFVTLTGFLRRLRKKCQTAAAFHARQCNWLRAQHLACLGCERARQLCSESGTKQRATSNSGRVRCIVRRIQRAGFPGSGCFGSSCR